MIRFVNNENIDRNLWDKTIMQSSMPMIYAMSWYLDIVAPEWHGFIQDDYKTVMPIVSSRKFGLTYLYQPPFCQQHGVFGNNVSADLVKEFIIAIKSKFRFAEIMLNEINELQVDGVIQNVNITLALSKNIEEIRKAYNDNTKRNIKKAEQSGLTVHKGFAIENLISLFKANKGKTLEKSDKWYKILKTLAYQLHYKGYANTYNVINQKNEIIAGILLIEFNKRAILLFSGAGNEARETGAMHFLIDSILSGISNTNDIFDFEGSNNSNLAKFYMGFGGKISTYPFVRINQLPICYRFIKKKGISIT